jgi:hypothetical protein
VQISQVFAREACPRRLKCCASVRCAQRAFTPRHSPQTPDLRHTRRPPRRVDVPARNCFGVANSGEAICLLDAPRAPSSNGSLSCGFSQNWDLYRIVIIAAADSWRVTNAACRSMEELDNEHLMSPCPRCGRSGHPLQTRQTKDG